jgi:MerR HTH family regulatory protein
MRRPLAAADPTDQAPGAHDRSGRPGYRTAPGARGPGGGPGRPRRAAGRVEGLTSAQVCTRARISYRQLDYWCRTGDLQPIAGGGQGPGCPRVFSEQEATKAQLLAEMINQGLSLPAARWYLERGQRARVVVEPLPGLPAAAPAEAAS